MASYTTPPPHPWFPRAASAFNPMRAWLPFDHGGSFREFVRGDHAAITGTAAWTRGSYGHCFQGNGSSYGVSGTFASTDALTLTIAHISGVNAFRGLLGWGGLANQGILYSGPRLAVIDTGTTERFAVNMAVPSTAWQVISLTLAGHASGSAAAFWVNGSLAGSGVLSATLSPATQFWIGALRGGTNPWQGNIGPSYFHDRVLAGREIRELHTDIWRYLRDQDDPLPLIHASIPWQFSFAATLGAPVASIAPAFSWPFSVAAELAPPEAEADPAFTWPLGFGAELAAPEADAAFDGDPPPWVFSFAGVLAPPTCSFATGDATPRAGVLPAFLLDQVAAIERPGGEVDANRAPRPQWHPVHAAARCRLTEMTMRDQAIQQRDGRIATHWVDFNGDWSRIVPADGRIRVAGKVFLVTGVTAIRGPGYVAYTAVACREVVG